MPNHLSSAEQPTSDIPLNPSWLRGILATACYNPYTTWVAQSNQPGENLITAHLNFDENCILNPPPPSFLVGG